MVGLPSKLTTYVKEKKRKKIYICKSVQYKQNKNEENEYYGKLILREFV